MNTHDATEVAYKNGYKAGVKEFSERLKDALVTIDGTFECWEVEDHIDNLVAEMTEQKG